MMSVAVPNLELHIICVTRCEGLGTLWPFYSAYFKEKPYVNISYYYLCIIVIIIIGMLMIRSCYI